MLSSCRATPADKTQTAPLQNHAEPPFLPRECLVHVEVAQRAGSVAIQPVVDLAHVKPVEAREDSHAVPGLMDARAVVAGPFAVLERRDVAAGEKEGKWR